MSALNQPGDVVFAPSYFFRSYATIFLAGETRAGENVNRVKHYQNESNYLHKVVEWDEVIFWSTEKGSTNQPPGLPSFIMKMDL
jgi:hypothetical protein